MILGTVTCAGSFALAIIFDQPYGPVLVATLLVTASARSSVRRGP